MVWVDKRRDGVGWGLGSAAPIGWWVYHMTQGVPHEPGWGRAA